MKIDVKQRPGYSYPKPPSHVRINETNRSAANGAWHQPVTSMFRWIHNKH